MAKRRYTVTQEKLEANRKNAQRSTGPRTPDGKLASSLNALKHGILAKEVIGSGAILGESLEDFESLLAGLVEAYKPIDKVEELAVETIAMIHLRKARASIGNLAVRDDLKPIEQRFSGWPAVTLGVADHDVDSVLTPPLALA